MKILSLAAALIATAVAAPAAAEPAPPLDCSDALEASTRRVVFEVEVELERPYTIPADAWPGLYAITGRLRSHLASREMLACFTTYPQERIAFTRWAKRFVIPTLERAERRLDAMCTEHGRDLIDRARQQLDRAFRSHAVGEARALADRLDRELGADIVAGCESLATEVDELRGERIPEIRDHAARPAVAAEMLRRQRRIAGALRDAESALATSGRDMVMVGRDERGWRDLRADARECLRFADELDRLGAAGTDPIDPGLSLEAATATCTDFLAQADSLAERSRDHDDRCRQAQRDRFKRYQIHGWGMHVVFDVHDIPDQIVTEGGRVEWIYHDQGECRRFQFDRRGRSLGESSCPTEDAAPGGEAAVSADLRS